MTCSPRVQPPSPASALGAVALYTLELSRYALGAPVRMDVRRWMLSPPTHARLLTRCPSSTPIVPRAPEPEPLGPEAAAAAETDMTLVTYAATATERGVRPPWPAPRAP